ncbi:ribonuclease H-like domain-containing protein [Usnea florida]
MSQPSDKQVRSGGNRNNAPPPRGPALGRGNEDKGGRSDDGDRNLGSSAASSTVSGDLKSVKNKEDLLLEKCDALKRTATRYPCRKSYGTKGNPVELRVNYFQIKLPDDLILYRYNLMIERQVEAEKKPGSGPKEEKKLSEPKGKKLKQIISIRLKNLMREMDSRKLGCYIATDYKSNLVCTTLIPQDLLNAEVAYFHEDDLATGSSNSPKYLVHIQETPPHLTTSQLNNFLTSTESDAQYDLKETMLQALNILFGQHAKSTPTTTMVGGNRAYTSAEDAERESLGAGIEAARGYFSSVRLCSFSSMVNVNVSHCAFYEAVTLEEFIEKMPAISDETDKAYYHRLEAFLKGIRVRTKYFKDPSGNQITKMFSIHSFATTEDGQWQRHPPTVNEFAAQPSGVWFHLDDAAGFEKKEKLKKKGVVMKNYVKVEDYFKMKHDVDSDPNGTYPTINFGSKKDPRYVPTEACTVIRGQLAKLTPDETDMMIKFAVRKPYANSTSITTKGLPALGLKPLPTGMTNLGIRVNTSMSQVSGRVLEVPKVLYRDGKEPETALGGWNLRQGSKFAIALPNAVGGILGNWGFLRLRRFSDKNPKSAISAFMRNISDYGITPNQPVSWTLDYDQRKNNFFDSDGNLEQTIARAKRSKRIEILLVALPAKDTALYNRIKRISDQSEGIHTVCVVENRFLKSQLSYFGNLALKFNLKLGGTNHTLSKTDMGIVSQGKTMVVGIDVVHPSPGSGRASIASMVASIDKDLAQWPVDLRIQIRKGQEMLDKIGDMINSRLALWMGHHKKYPENILVYRDGVSEGQYEQVLNEELDEMRKKSQDLYTKFHQPFPRFTLIIVAKRHHTRFFPTGKNAPFTEKDNFKRGLVVDRGITEPRTWDFFLHSHTAIQGTARPAHYVVLWDEIFTADALRKVHEGIEAGLSETDRLQKLTNSLCYLFGRATKAVKIPAPVYYADIACDRASRYLAGEDTGGGESEMTEGQRVERCRRLQERIEVHDSLKDSMFYV